MLSVDSGKEAPDDPDSSHETVPPKLRMTKVNASRGASLDRKKQQPSKRLCNLFSLASSSFAAFCSSASSGCEKQLDAVSALFKWHILAVFMPYRMKFAYNEYGLKWWTVLFLTTSLDVLVFHFASRRSRTSSQNVGKINILHYLVKLSEREPAIISCLQLKKISKFNVLLFA